MEIKPEPSHHNKITWQVLFGIVLIVLSALVYTLQILIFHKHEETFFLMVQDIAFIPISVLLVTLILEGVLNHREKRALQEKLYMVIGTFFTEMGMELLRTLSAYDKNRESFQKVLNANLEFSDKNLDIIRQSLNTHDFSMHSLGGDLPALKSFLATKRESVLRLLENPNLLEHETFTNLLWAVSHLAEELHYRSDVVHLSQPDRMHIEQDMARAYSLLSWEWLAYARHLRLNYPYIFSLVIRINPFNPAPSAEYTEDCSKRDANVAGSCR